MRSRFTPWAALPAVVFVACRSTPISQRQVSFAPASPESGACYEGPLALTVLNPDGTAAGNTCVGIFGATWRSGDGDDPPRRDTSDPRTDAAGRFSMARARECVAPTFLYAYDESRRLAGVTWINRTAELAKPQTIRLREACLVRGTIRSTEAGQRGLPLKWPTATLKPMPPRGIAPRRLLSCCEQPTRDEWAFGFLVPPGTYRLSLMAENLESRTESELVVPEGQQTIALGAFDLPLFGPVRLRGAAAPDWDVTEWSDGQSRDLASFRGRPLILCFYWKELVADQSLGEFLALRRRFKPIDVAMVVIAGHEPGGLAELQSQLREQKKMRGNWAPFDAEISHWPFPVGVDRAGEEPGALGRTFAAYGVNDVTMILIGPDGTVRANSRVAGDWIAALESLEH